MRKLLLALSLVGLVVLGPVAGEEEKRKKNEEPIKVITLDRKTPVLYEKEIEPILVNKCNFCHSGNIKEGKLDLASYETLMKGGNRGKPIVAGKSVESMLVTLCAKAKRP